MESSEISISVVGVIETSIVLVGVVTVTAVPAYATGEDTLAPSTVTKEVVEGIAISLLSFF